MTARDEALHGRAVFIPISLNTKYFSFKKNFQDVFSRYVAGADRALILICDALHIHSLMARGSTRSRAESSVDEWGSNTVRMVENVAAKFDSDHWTVRRWEALSQEEGFRELNRALRRVIESDTQLSEHMHHLAKHYVAALHLDSADALDYELQYVFDETVMSLYITELKGFDLELSERKPDPKMLPLVDYLYCKKEGTLRALLEKETLDRQLELLD